MLKAALTGLSLALLSATPSVVADENAFDYCLVCHGSQAAGNAAIGGPNLTILDSWYLEEQLLAFDRGFRGRHPEDHLGLSMTSAARMLESPERRAAAIAFVEAFPAAYAVATVNGDEERGKALYQRCGACHGQDGAGSEPLHAPALAGQNDWYIVKQLRDYREGRRGMHPEDSYGAAMRAAVMLLPDDSSIDDLGAYIQSAFGDSPGSQPAGDELLASTVATPETPTSEEGTAMKGKSNVSLARSVLPAVALTAATSGVLAHDATRYPLPNGSTFPIAQAVTVPAGTELTFHSGLLPAPADPEAEPGSRAFLGDTYTQTMSVLQQFEASLKAKGMGLGNIIKMNVYLVGDPELDGKMDFGGFMRAYSQFFGTEEQPHLPARAAVQIAGLARGAFVEIEVIAAR